MPILIAILLARADAGFLEGKLAGAEGFENEPRMPQQFLLR